jgi:AraC-like DNA-binding protein
MVMAINISVFFLSLIILFYNWGKHFTPIYFAVSLTCMSVLSTNIQLILNAKSEFYFAIFVVNSGPVVYLIGPFFFFFVRSMLTNGSKLKKLDLLYFIPFALSLIETIPYICTSFDYKLNIARSIIQNPLLLKTAPFKLFIPIYLNNVIRLLYTLFFVCLSATWFISFCAKNLKGKAVGQKNMLTNYKWLAYIILVYILITTNLLIVLNIFGHSEDNSWTSISKIYALVNAIAYLTVPLSILIFPEILYGISNSNIVNFKKSTLSEEELKRLNNLFFKKLAYLNPAISLDSFSKEVEINKDELAFYIEQNEHLNFVDFVNKTRVEYLIDLLKDNQNDEYTIEALAKMSGFSTRQTMYLAFKRFKNSSPSEYLYSINN